MNYPQKIICMKIRIKNIKIKYSDKTVNRYYPQKKFLCFWIDISVWTVNKSFTGVSTLIKKCYYFNSIESTNTFIQDYLHPFKEYYSGEKIIKVFERSDLYPLYVLFSYYDDANSLCEYYGAYHYSNSLKELHNFIRKLHPLKTINFIKI